MSERPIVAITMGDPAGVGPEVTAKALARDEVWDCCLPLAIGDASVLGRAMTPVEALPALHPISYVSDVMFNPLAPDVLYVPGVDVTALPPGEISAAAGQASVAYVKKATRLAQRGQVDAIVTGPINKAALRAADIPYLGHTELLAALTGQERVTTMLVTPGSSAGRADILRVVHVTRHVPLAEVAALITPERVLETMRITHAGMQRMDFAHPRLAVAALNPHGGDEGLLGREEIKAIRPAVEEAQAEGINAHGPIPADSVFFRAIRGEFDAVVAMYHDQGHIPIKTYGFERSVTVTLGLPIVRTSVDHGTAFDIAWQGAASEESMVEAIRLAAQLA